MRQREEGAGSIPIAERGAPRTSRRALLGAAGAGVLALAASQSQLAAQEPAAADIAVFPRHGTRTASMGTEISFRGVAIDAAGVVEVAGSLSGDHSGLLMPHSDGAGVSFVPDAPFQAGERVTVRAGVPLRSSPGGSVTFRVATPGIPVKKEASREVDQPESPPQEFRTRPDLLPPAITITTLGDATAPGHVFVAAKVPDGRNGAMIIDEDGDLVWFSPLDIDVAEHNDLRVQHYRGEPVLTMWEGVSQVGTGFGHFVLLNAGYDVMARLQVGNGYHGADLHECLLTDHGTALAIVYNPVRWNLTAGGGAEDGTALDGIVQEIDIETGRVVFEWHSLDHIELDEAIGEPPEDTGVPWDYFHLNSVEEDETGNLILSARHTNGIYKIERTSGRVLWRLNGTRSDFAMGEGTPFAYQHDARVHPNGELTLFDNAESDQDKEGEIPSRGMVLRLDEDAKTATLVREYLHPTGVLSVSQGNMQGCPMAAFSLAGAAHRCFPSSTPRGTSCSTGAFRKAPTRTAPIAFRGWAPPALPPILPSNSASAMT